MRRRGDTDHDLELGVVTRPEQQALHRGIKTGTVPPELNPADGAGVLIAVLLGFLLERVAFGLDDAQGTDGFVAAVRHLMP